MAGRLRGGHMGQGNSTKLGLEPKALGLLGQVTGCSWGMKGTGFEFNPSPTICFTSLGLNSLICKVRLTIATTFQRKLKEST